MAIIRDYATLNNFETLLPIAKNLGVDAATLAGLEQSADRATIFDAIDLGVMLLVFVIGLTIALVLYFGPRRARSSD